jgi:TPR repeat protein
MVRDSGAMNNLALQYEDGRGVPRDIEHARRLYEQSFRSGFHGAAANLARLLITKKEGVTDVAEVCRWLAETNDTVNRSRYCGAGGTNSLLAARAKTEPKSRER